MYLSIFNSFRVIRCLSQCVSPKIAILPHFCFPWGRPWGNHAKCCMDGKRIRCLQIVSQHVPIYLQQFPFNRSIFNDLERPQTQISRSGHSLTLNISEVAKDTAKNTTNIGRYLHPFTTLNSIVALITFYFTFTNFVIIIIVVYYELSKRSITHS